MFDYISAICNDYLHDSPFFQFISVSQNKNNSVSVIFKGLKLFGCSATKSGITISVKNDIFANLELPPTCEIRNIKSDKDFSRIFCSSENQDFKSLMEQIIKLCPKYLEDNYMSEDAFDCCSRYMECSNALHCVNPDLLFAKGCTYRVKLQNGIVFFGKNRNIN